MIWTKDDYRITDQTSELDPEGTVALLRLTYWAKDRPLEVIRKSIERSLNFGLFHGTTQIGFARIVSDFATFAWLCDVIVAPEHRGKGLALWLVDTVCKHPDLAGVRILLATRDAHPLYERLGFTDFHDNRFMGIGFPPLPPGEG